MSMLQVQLGDDLFNQIMKEYFQRFAYHHPHTEDFQAIVEEYSGRSWQTEFDFWLRGTGTADIRLSDLRSSQDSTTVILGGSIPHNMLVPVAFISDSDTLEMLVNVLPEEENVITVAGNWTRAVADPFMRLPDCAPWNNSAPADFKLKPLLLPVPQPDHYSVWALPLPGYADGSWRVNAVFLATPLPVEAGGPFTLTSHVSVPFKEGSSAAVGLSLSAPISRRCGEEILLNTRFFSGYGINRIGARFRLNSRGPLATDSRRMFSLGAEMLSISDTTVYGGDNIQTGTSMEIQASLRLSKRSFNRSISAGLESFFDPGLTGNAYAGLSLEAETSQRLSGGFTASTRVNAEGVTENAPVQRMVRPAGGLFFENALVGAVFSPDGELSAINHYFVRTGPALPGYWNSIRRGRVGFSIEQRLSSTDIPLGFFAGTGWVGSSSEEFTSGTLLSNAGILVNAGIVEAIFPLWVSEPVEGENNWELRWRVRIIL